MEIIDVGKEAKPKAPRKALNETVVIDFKNRSEDLSNIFEEDTVNQ